MARKHRKSSEMLATGGVLEGLAELVGQAVEAIGETQTLQSEGRDREALDRLSPVGDRLEGALVLQRAAMILYVPR